VPELSTSWELEVPPECPIYVGTSISISNHNTSRPVTTMASSKFLDIFRRSTIRTPTRGKLLKNLKVDQIDKFSRSFTIYKASGSVRPVDRRAYRSRQHRLELTLHVAGREYLSLDRQD
jgi:hypothetical protein